MMRIISGVRRGKKLDTLPGEDTRPTLERVKQGLFSAIQFELEGRKVLDLFAGSGQLGLEALSRGAASCWFNDCNPKALAVVSRNIAACGFEPKSRTSCLEYAECIVRIAQRDLQPDLVFLDPPYGQGLIGAALTQLSPLLPPGALVAAESPAEEPVSLAGLTLRREYRYGPIKVTLMQKE